MTLFADKFKARLELEFFSCPRTEESAALKEQLASEMAAKYEECIGYGYDDVTSYVLACKVINNHKAELRALHKKFFYNIKFEKVINFLLITVAYFFGVTFLYLLLSFTVPGGWSWTWGIFVGAAFVYGTVLNCFLLSYTRATNHNVLACFSIIFGLLCAFCGVYLLISFLTKLWAYTWIAFLIYGVTAYACCAVYLWRQKGRKLRTLDYMIMATLLCTAIYFVVSFVLSAFNVTWLIFVGFVFFLLVWITVDTVLLKKKGDAPDEDDPDDFPPENPIIDSADNNSEQKSEQAVTSELGSDFNAKDDEKTTDEKDNSSLQNDFEKVNLGDNDAQQSESLAVADNSEPTTADDIVNTGDTDNVEADGKADGNANG